MCRYVQILISAFLCVHICGMIVKKNIQKVNWLLFVFIIKITQMKYP